MHKNSNAQNVWPSVFVSPSKEKLEFICRAKQIQRNFFNVSFFSRFMSKAVLFSSYMATLFAYFFFFFLELFWTRHWWSVNRSTGFLIHKDSSDGFLNSKGTQTHINTHTHTTTHTHKNIYHIIRYK